MKRKAIAMLMIASMTVALFAGCGSKSDESDSGKVKLTFLDKHPEDEYKGYFEEAIADFEKENPDIEIEYENISDQAMKEKLSVLAAGGDLPDIFFWMKTRNGKTVFFRHFLAVVYMKEKTMLYLTGALYYICFIISRYLQIII